MAMATTLTERDDGGRVRAHVGDTIELLLPEVASTGYRWSTEELDTHLFELNDVGADYPEETIGAAGQARFRVIVRAPGNGMLRLKYWRHWEGEASVTKRFAVAIEATP
jgi:inhibitor of cysteine peptidase